MSESRGRIGDASTTAWVEPRVVGLGSLVEITQSSSLFFGHPSGAHDLALSGAVQGNQTFHADQGELADGSGDSSQLPFTGYPILVTAALGSVVSAAGIALRRALKRFG